MCWAEFAFANADIEEGQHSTLLSQIANNSYRLEGEKLQCDAKTESFDSKLANAMLKREDREPWVVLDKV